MKKLFGGPGTLCGLSLRIRQCTSVAASIGFMVSAKKFSLHTAFCYLIASMSLQLLWSFGLAYPYVYALRGKKDLQNQILISLFVVGDWATTMLSLATACSSAGVVVLYEKDIKYCNTQSQSPCLRVHTVGGTTLDLHQLFIEVASKMLGVHLVINHKFGDLFQRVLNCAFVGYSRLVVVKKKNTFA